MEGAAGKGIIKGNNTMHVTCSGFDEDQIEFIKGRVKTLDGEFAEIGTTTKDRLKYRELTHVIVRDNEDKYTAKILLAANCAVSIVKLSWLWDSYTEGKILPHEDYVPSFLQQALKNATLARSSGGILAGFSVFATSGVTGSGEGKLTKPEMNLLCTTAGLKLLATQASVCSQPDASKVLIITSSIDEKIKAQKLIAANENGSSFIPLPNLLNVFRYQDQKALHRADWKPEEEVKTTARKPLGASLPNEGDEDTVGFLGGDLDRRQPAPRATLKAAPKPKSCKKSTSCTSTKPKSSKKSTSGQAKTNALKTNALTPAPKQATSKLDSVLKKQGFPHGIRLKTVVEGEGHAPSPTRKAEPKNDEAAESDSFKTPAKKAGSKNDDNSFTTPHAVPHESNYVLVHRIKLARSPERTTSVGKYCRLELGEDGMLNIFKCANTGNTQVRYVYNDGIKMLDAELDLGCVGEVYDTVKGNAGFENVFWWDALNKAHAAGGTTIKGAKNPTEAIGLRRYFLWFETLGDLVKTIYFVFGENIHLVCEFLKKDGKMTMTKKSRPCHAVEATEDDMDTDDSDDEINFPPMAVLEIEDNEGYYPGAESQPY